MSYLLNTPQDVAAMLQRIGVSSIDELFAPIPAALRLNRPLDIPPALGEIELTQLASELAKANQAAGDGLGIQLGPIVDQVRQRLTAQGVGAASLIPSVNRTIIIGTGYAAATARVASAGASSG